MKTEPWHSLSVEEVFRAIDSTPEGLQEAEARLRQKTYGKNIISDSARPGIGGLFLRQFKNPLILFLGAAGGISIFLEKGTDALVIFAAALLNVCIGFFQEFQADRTFQKLKQQMKISAVAVRDGAQKVVDAAELVPGDVIVLHSGDKVPADARLIFASALRVNEAVLTGEWLAVEKNLAPMPPDTPLADRSSMVWAGASVEEGRGIAVVTAIGSETEFGRVVLLSTAVRKISTPLQEDIEYLAKLIGRVAAGVILVLFLLGLSRDVPASEMFLISVAVAVAAVPEGLPAAVSVVLAVGMKNILRRKGLIRQMLATETLGRTSIILTDKTGTLTQAKMQVARLCSGHEVVHHNAKKLSNETLQSAAGHILILKIGIFTSEAFVEHIESGLDEWVPRGKPTDQAFLLAGIQAGLSPEELFRHAPRIGYVPFSPVRKYSFSLHREGTKHRLYYAGAPEILLEKSTWWYDEGRISPLTPQRRDMFIAKMAEFEKIGERILGTAYCETEITKLPAQEKDIAGLLDNAVFMGFVSFHDPVRSDAPEAMKLCQDASIQPIIITGDRLRTTQAVAERIGLFVRDDETVEAHTIRGLSDEELKKKVHHWKIYARAVPEDKLRIAQAWQARDEVVAMVGDGVNDAPALKRADIGIALGSGTEVAKEASLVVLLDDSFSTIVRAIEEGRVILDNIRKLITYLLSTGFAEMILIGGGLLFGLPLPLLAPQILWINLVTEGPQTFALAFEPKEKDIMSRPPMKRKVPLFTKEMFVLIFVIGIVSACYSLGLYALLILQGWDIATSRTVVFLSLSAAAIFFVFSLKSLRRPIWEISFAGNKVQILTTFISLALLFSAIHIPVLEKVLYLEPISLREFFIVLLVGIVNLLTIELGKLYFITRKLT